MTTLIALAVLGTAWPKNLSVTLAGHDATSREPSNVCYHDKKTGYFAYKMLECDGGHRSIVLTRDRRMVEEAGYDTKRFGRAPKVEFTTPILERSFALKTGHGISIGMTREEVQKKLGKPAKTAVRGAKKEYWCALYKQAAMRTKEEGEVLRNTYIFKNGKLIEIAIHLDAVPGCGEDSLSDTGWPWTKF